MSEAKEPLKNKPEKTFNMKVMHAINIFAISVFVLGILYKIVQYLFFK